MGCEALICGDRQLMNAVLKIMHDDTALTNKAFENFAQVSMEGSFFFFFLEMDRPQRKISPNSSFCFQS